MCKWPGSSKAAFPITRRWITYIKYIVDRKLRIYSFCFHVFDPPGQHTIRSGLSGGSSMWVILHAPLFIVKLWRGYAGRLVVSHCELWRRYLIFDGLAYPFFAVGRIQLLGVTVFRLCISHRFTAGPCSLHRPTNNSWFREGNIFLHTSSPSE